jgi:hypothetical protein
MSTSGAFAAIIIRRPAEGILRLIPALAIMRPVRVCVRLSKG